MLIATKAIAKTMKNLSKSVLPLPPNPVDIS